MVDMIMCVADPEYLKIGEENGLVIGANTSQAGRTIKNGFEIDFLDFDFKHPDLDKHLELCENLTPKYACAPDIFRESELDSTLDYANELKRYSENVIIIPKCACIDRIEKSWIIGYSVPTQYGGAEGFTTWDLHDHRVHLLGGSPGKQLFYKKLIRNIVSFDGNSYIKIARQSHQYWSNNTPHWKTCTNASTHELITRSIHNILNEWSK